MDLDGVCCDFVLQAINYHNKNEEEYIQLLKSDSNHPYDVLNNYLGVESNNKWWEWIEDQGSDFWENMPVFSWFDYLYSELTKISDVKFLTSAPMMATAHHGKAKWIEKNVGKSALYDLIICPSPMKQFLSKPGRVLIDDTTKNVIEWNGHGGHAFHFPSIQFFHRHPTDDDIKETIQFAKDHI